VTHKAYWAYAFKTSQALGAICTAWNAAGPWQWQIRDSHWYGDYLNTRPIDGVRVRVHEPAGPHSALGPDDPRAKGKQTALLQIEESSAATYDEIDGTFRMLVAAIGAKEPEPITPYD
jgi:hypothetical protein